MRAVAVCCRSRPAWACGFAALSTLQSPHRAVEAMKPSDELYTFGVTLNQDFFRYGSRLEDIVKGALLDMLPADRRALKRQIDGWLEAGVSNADLEDMFAQTPADMYVKGDVSRFYRMIRDTVVEIEAKRRW